MNTMSVARYLINLDNQAVLSTHQGGNKCMVYLKTVRCSCGSWERFDWHDGTCKCKVLPAPHLDHKC